ncbi:DUF1189 family protein [Candidatus Roizmanbacteria bacterium]|nr:DUF1189 family protein [Candidatus Roizmanbacteria bacterium]
MVFSIFVLFYVQPFRRLSTFNKRVNTAIEAFPRDLSIQIHNGRANANIDQPYLMWLNVTNNPLLFFVVDIKASPERIHDYNSLTLLTARSLVINKEVLTFSLYKHDIEIPLKGYSGTIDLPFMLSVENTLTAYFKLASLIFPFLLFVFIPFSLIVYETLIVIGASCLLYILYALAKKTRNFTAIVQFFLHASTVPLIVGYSLILLAIWFCSTLFAL